ncbi:MAG: hypothetical protein HZC37_14220 [Burkholderiales bacterium]|nr:hypothetical protein [Burkholderiales bacterium]
MRRALELNAAGAVIADNHPSGCAEPVLILMSTLSSF